MNIFTELQIYLTGAVLDRLKRLNKAVFALAEELGDETDINVVGEKVNYINALMKCRRELEEYKKEYCKKGRGSYVDVVGAIDDVDQILHRVES